MIGNFDDETNFSHKLLLTNRSVANLRKAFANYLSIDYPLPPPPPPPLVISKTKQVRSMIFCKRLPCLKYFLKMWRKFVIVY